MNDNCKNEYEFPGIYHKEKQLCGMICPKCEVSLPEAYVKNRVGLFLKEVVKYYYSGKISKSNMHSTLEVSEIKVTFFSRVQH